MKKKKKRRTVYSYLSKKERAEITHMRRVIGQEKRRAREAGKYWTRWRPFTCGWERLGKMRCGNARRHRNGRNAVVVSYCVGMKGCVVMCQQCYDRRLKTADFDTSGQF